MVLVTAYIKYKAGHKEDLINVCNACIKETRKEAGNESYNLYADTESDTLLFFEKWVSQASLDEHMKTPHFKTFAAGIEQHLAGDLVLKTYEVE